MNAKAHIKYILTILIIWQFAFNISTAAITAFLRLFKQLLLYFGQIFDHNQFKKFGNAVPLTIKSVHRMISLQTNCFESYVVCLTCDSIYNFEDCVKTSLAGHLRESKRCRHVHFPNHPRVSQRVPCGSLLLRKVKCKRSFRLLPLKVYPYKQLQHSCEQLLKKEGFMEKCEQWRSRTVPEGYLCDIYDGLLWKKFSSVEKNNFLCFPHCYLLSMNVDWFEPFERGVYSTGVIYLTILNLPRNERYLTENVIIVGIIPGPREPKKSINSYLTPLVLELKEAWEHGITVLKNDNTSVCIKLALGCVTCDIPACRKVCGFLSHNAALGCNKCLKQFKVTFGERTDYSGYNRDEWVPRSLQQHKEDVIEVLKQTTKTAQQTAESQYGLRYSALLQLPYFDPIEYTAIDIMHNMFLGTGKHVFSVWVEMKTLSKQNLEEIEQRIKLFKIPNGVGRLPSHMSSGYGSFTANQWKNWICVYSSVILKDMLPTDDFRCWQLFVRSCVIISSYYTQESSISTADLLLKQFCIHFMRLYGPDKFTFNMHLHLHLKQTLLNFGPAHTSWCYAFERYNGYLGSYYTNNKAIEPQIMQKFTQHQAVHGIPMSPEVKSIFCQ